MAKYRPKHEILYRYGTEHHAYVHCYPQSRWELEGKSDSEVMLSNKHTEICMTPEDFEQYWIEVRQKERIC